MRTLGITAVCLGLLTQTIAQWEDIPKWAWDFKALAYEKCGQGGHRHKSIDNGRVMLQELAAEFGFELTVTDDNNDITRENLEQYDVLLLNQPTAIGVSLNADQKAALQWYADEFKGTGGWRDRSGVFGWHGATDMKSKDSPGDWDWYRDWLGRIYGYAKGGFGTLTTAEELPAGHPAEIVLSAFPNPWVSPEAGEWYGWNRNFEATSGLIPVSWLSSFHEGYDPPPDRYGTWVSERARALALFSLIGHSEYLFSEEDIRNYFIGSILFVSGYGQPYMLVGCMDPNAVNYDMTAKIPCEDCCGTVGISARSDVPGVHISSELISVISPVPHAVQVTDVNAKTVLSSKSQGSGDYDLSSLGRGVYLVQVKTGGREWVSRIFRH